MTLEQSLDLLSERLDTYINIVEGLKEEREALIELIKCKDKELIIISDLLNKYQSGLL